MSHTKTVDITPHWPGMLKWIRAAAIARFGARSVDRIVITGGADTGMFVWAEDDGVRDVWQFCREGHGEWSLRRDLTLPWLEEHAYCVMRRIPEVWNVIVNDVLVDVVP